RRLQDAFASQALHAAFAQHIRAVGVCPAVVLDVLLARVQRPVRRRVRHICEKWLLCLPDESNSLISDGIGVVEVRALGFVLGVGLAARESAWIEVAAAAGNRAEKSLKTSAGRPRIVELAHLRRKVPLARQAGPVA